MLSKLTPLCPYCGRFSKESNGSEIYPHRPDLKHKKFYLCAGCDAYVGCHEKSGLPLGRLANSTLRAAKMLAHDSFDPLWRNEKEPRKARKKAYSWLAKKMGVDRDDCHIGMFSEDQCMKVVRICSSVEYGELS